MMSFVFTRLAPILPHTRRCLMDSERRDALKLIQVRVLNSTAVSFKACPPSTDGLSAHRSCLRQKGIINKVLPSYFQTQRRNLLRHVRRPVPFNLALHLYGQLIETPEKIKPRNTDGGVSLLRRLAATGNPEELIKTLSTSDIITCLYAWGGQRNFTSRTTSIVQSLYDDKKARGVAQDDLNMLFQVELSKRLKDEDLETLFHCAHAAFRSGGKKLYFLPSFFIHILEEFDEMSLTTSQFAKILFYIYYHGDAPERLLFNLQNYLSENIESFDFNELHIACLGFFRANKRINDYAVLNVLADRLLQNLNAVSGDALVSIMKTFRHSGFTKVSFFSELAERLTTMNMQNITSLNQVMHLAMAFGSLRLYNKAFLASLVSRTKQILNTTPRSVVRTKDLGRLVWALGTFCYKDEDLLRNTVVPLFKESLSGKATVQYPESLVDVAMGMAYLGLYSDDIINAIFSPNTAAKLRDMPVLEKTNQLLYLHHSVKLEHRSYHGNTLSQSFLDSLPAKIYGDMNRELSFRQGLSLSLITLQNLLGKDKIRCTFILPHYQTADLEVHLDVEGQPVPIDGDSDPNTKPNVHKRIAIEVIGQNQCAVDSEMLLGNPRSKMRQLNRLGYITHVVSPADAKKLDTMDTQRREEYWRRILSTALKVKL